MSNVEGEYSPKEGSVNAISNKEQGMFNVEQRIGLVAVLNI